MKQIGIWLDKAAGVAMGVVGGIAIGLNVLAVAQGKWGMAILCVLEATFCLCSSYYYFWRAAQKEEKAFSAFEGEKEKGE